MASYDLPEAVNRSLFNWPLIDSSERLPRQKFSAKNTLWLRYQLASITRKKRNSPVRTSKLDLRVLVTRFEIGNFLIITPQLKFFRYRNGGIQISVKF